VNRGILRFYVLKLISKSESPISGYSLMKLIEEETAETFRDLNGVLESHCKYLKSLA